MKAIIEKAVNTTGKESLDSQICTEFFSIISLITNTSSEATLRMLFKNMEYIYFEFGFGGSHMWVKQTGYLNDNNLITVLFE